MSQLLRTSERGREIIKRSEGLELTAYLDIAGVPTIGYGHTLSVTHDDVGRRTITAAEAEELLLSDLFTAENDVLRATAAVDLNQNQFDALVSFVFNLGIGRLLSSTLLKRIRAGRFEDVPFELSRWVYATNRHTGRKEKMPGLIKRRAEEAALFSEPVMSETFSDEPMPRGTISPEPLRPEREQLRYSRTMRGGTAATVGSITSGASAAVMSVDPIMDRVDWLSSALAAAIVIGLVMCMVGGLYVLYVRRKEFIKAHR
jgi:lysozyme